MKITSSQMLANEIRRQRKRQNLTQRSVAELVGVKQSTISALENTPDGTKLETLFKVLTALKLELNVSQRDSSHNIEGWDQEW